MWSCYFQLPITPTVPQKGTVLGLIGTKRPMVTGSSFEPNKTLDLNMRLLFFQSDNRISVYKHKENRKSRPISKFQIVLYVVRSGLNPRITRLNVLKPILNVFKNHDLVLNLVGCRQELILNLVGCRQGGGSKSSYTQLQSIAQLFCPFKF